MANEEMQRNVEFVIQQQAQFVGDIHRINETLATQGRLISDQDTLLRLQNETIIPLLSVVNRASAAQEKHEARITNLAEKMPALAERVSTLSGRVDAFINFVEKYIAISNSGRNGETIQ